MTQKTTQLQSTISKFQGTGFVPQFDNNDTIKNYDDVDNRIKSVGKKIPLLEMIEKGLDRDTIQTMVKKYQDMGHYIDEQDNEKAEMAFKLKENEIAQKKDLKNGFLDRIKNVWQRRGEDTVNLWKQEMGEKGIDPRLAENLEKRGFDDKLQELSSLSAGFSADRAVFGTGANLLGGYLETGFTTATHPFVLAKNQYNKIFPDGLFSEEVKKTLLEVGDFALTHTGAKRILDFVGGLQERYPMEAKDVGYSFDYAGFFPITSTAKTVTTKTMNYIDDVLSPVLSKAKTKIDDTFQIGLNMVNSNRVPTLRPIKAKNITDYTVVATQKTIDVLSPVLSKAKNEITDIHTRWVYNSQEKTAINNVLSNLPKSVVAKEAYRLGVLPKDISTVYNSTPIELRAGNEMIERAFRLTRGENLKNGVEEVVGNSFLKVYKATKSVVDDLNGQLDNIASSLSTAKLVDAQKNALEGLQSLSAFKGLTTKAKIGPEDIPLYNQLITQVSNGKKLTSAQNQLLEGIIKGSDTVLDFTNTTISMDTSAQKTISKFYNKLKNINEQQGHLLRKEMFDYVNSTQFSKNDSLGFGIQAMRTSLLNQVGVGTEYKDLSTKIATILTEQNKIERLLSAVSDSSEDLLKVRLSELSRRLTSNASADMLSRLEGLTRIANQYGYNVETNPTQLQAMYNIIDKYLNIKSGTSFKGQIRSAIGGYIPYSTSGMVAKGVSIASERLLGSDQITKAKAIEKLIKELIGEPISGIGEAVKKKVSKVGVVSKADDIITSSIKQAKQSGQSFDELARDDLQNKIIAGQDLGKEIGKKVNPDGTITLYHGTSKQNAQKIMEDGNFNEGSYFSVKKSGTEYGDSPLDVAKRKFGKDAEVIKIKVDARDLESAAAGSEVFSPNKLVKQADGSWASATIKTRSQLKAEWDKVSKVDVVSKTDDITTSIQKAKSGGKSFDEWVKGRFDAGDFHSRGKVSGELNFDSSLSKKSISRIMEENNLLNKFDKLNRNLKHYSNNWDNESFKKIIEGIDSEEYKIAKAMQDYILKNKIGGSDAIKLYRAGNQESQAPLLSYTTNRKIAEKFKEKLGGDIISKNIKIEDIAYHPDVFSVGSFGEGEVIVFNSPALKTRSQLKAKWDKVK